MIMLIPESVHRQDILDIHLCKIQPLNTNHSRLRESRENILELLAVDVSINNMDAVLKTPELQNEIEEADLEIL